MNAPIFRRITGRLQALSLSLSVACAVWLAATGCSQEKDKPKYADHEAAHTRRYHPAVPSRPADRNDIPRRQPDAATKNAPASQPGRASPYGCPVLFVNRQAITVQDVLEPLWQDLQRKAESLPPASYHAYLRQQVSRQVEFQIGLAVVYEKAQAAYAEDRYQEAFDKQADRMVQDVIDRRFGGVEVRYQAHLEKLGLSLQDVTKRAKRQVMVTQFLRDRFQPHVHEPTRRELMQYYRTHRDEFTTPAKAELFLLEIPLETLLGKPLQEATAEQVRKARAKARSELRQALQALNQGAEFAEVARTYSHGVRAKTGGYWGEISPGALANRWKSVNEVLFSLKSGQISEIVETDTSCFVVKCGRRTPEKTLSFEQAQEQILQDLAEQEFNRRRDAYVRELVEQAAIRPRNQFVLAVMAAAPEPVPRVGHTTRKPR